MDFLEPARALLDALLSEGVLRYASVLLLVFLRVVFLTALTPVFGGQATPARFRIGVAIVLALCLAPAVDRARVEPGAGLVVLAAREVLIGLTMAVFLRIVFEMIAAIGALVDLARGATMMQIFDPLAREQQTPLGLLYSVAALALFFALGGHHVLFGALAASFESAPLGSVLPDPMDGRPAVLALVALFSALFVQVVQMAAPVLAVMLIVDVALGLIDRIAQGIQVFFLGMGLKSLAALALVWLAFGYGLPDLLLGSMERMLRFFAGS